MGRKVVRAFSMATLILYNRTEQCWVVCLDFQGVSRRVDNQVYFSIEPVGTNDLGFESEGGPAFRN